jgi:hypothetical protein
MFKIPKPSIGVFLRQEMGTILNHIASNLGDYLEGINLSH